MSELNPVKLRPAFKDYLWGGTKLITAYNKQSGLDILAESWELSAHKDGQSIIAGGEYSGCKLSEFIKKKRSGNTWYKCREIRLFSHTHKAY